MIGRMKADAPFQFYLRSAEGRAGDGRAADEQAARSNNPWARWVLGDRTALWALTAASLRSSRPVRETRRFPQVACC